MATAFTTEVAFSGVKEYLEADSADEMFTKHAEGMCQEVSVFEITFQKTSSFFRLHQGHGNRYCLEEAEQTPDRN